MKKFVYLLITSVIVVACGSKQPKINKTETSKTEPVQNEVNKPLSSNEFGMWKVANYAGDIGDNKNSLYLTNSLTIWGTQSNSASDNSELKVKFLVDKVSFCIKLYEYGRTVVKKGDEKAYKISIKSAQNEVVEFTAKNPSDRLFINEPEAKKIIELFNKGGRISFSLVSDSKTTPSTYSFTIENPEGFGNALKKLSE
jgi:hypothetical protein